MPLDNVTVDLQYFDGEKWVFCGNFYSEQTAWWSLGADTLNYRTINAETGEILTENKGEY